MILLFYITVIFGLANLFYFLFSDRKEIKRKFWLTIFLTSVILFIVDIFLSLISSDGLVDNTKEFLIFIVASVILSILVFLYHLELHKILNESSVFSKNYLRYVISFSLFSFFLNFIFVIVLFLILSIIFDIE